MRHQRQVLPLPEVLQGSKPPVDKITVGDGAGNWPVGSGISHFPGLTAAPPGLSRVTPRVREPALPPAAPLFWTCHRIRTLSRTRRGLLDLPAPVDTEALTS